jgi:hypothetical protein
MALPDFRDDGWLPEGHHTVTWDEVVEMFGGSPGSRRSMIENAHGLFVALHQLSRFADMLEALRRDAEERQDYREFAVLSGSYLARIHELNEEIKAYLRTEPEAINVVVGA